MEENTSYNFFLDYKDNRQTKTSVCLSQLIMISPLISGIMLSLTYLIFGERFTLFHMNLLCIVITFFTLIIVGFAIDFRKAQNIKQNFSIKSIKERTKQSPEALLIICSFLWMIFAGFFAPNFPSDFDVSATLSDGTYYQEGLIYFFVYIIIFISAKNLHSNNAKKNCLIMFITTTTIVCILTLFFHHKELIFYWQNNTNWANAFINSNHLGYVLCLSTSLLSVVFCLTKKIKTKVFIGFLLALHMFVCMFNDTLGSNLAITFGIILLPIVFSIKSKKFDWPSFIPFVLWIAISYICIPLAKPMDSTYTNLLNQIVGVFKDLFQITKDPVSEEAKLAGTNRWELWLDAFETIKKYPIFGDGNMIEKPHNEYLQFASHSGILCVILYIAGLVVLMVKGIKYFKQLSPLSIATLFTVMCYAINAFFGNTKQYVYPFFMVILGFAINSLNQDIKKYKDNKVINISQEQNNAS